MAEETTPKQDQAQTPTDPAVATKPLTVEDLAARLTQLEESSKATIAKLTGKLGQVTRERDAAKKASELDADTLAALTRDETLEERETGIVAREFGLDPELLKPYKGIEAKEGAAKRMKEAGQAEISSLRAEIEKLKSAVSSGANGAQKPAASAPAPPGGIPSSQTIKELAGVDTRRMSLSQLKEHSANLDAARRAAGFQR